MAYIVPFRALRYDPKRVDPATVVTQPYNKITPESQERYYASSPYNLVRLILGKGEPADNEQNNVYSRAAGFFRDWRRDGIFLQEPPHLIECERRTTQERIGDLLSGGWLLFPVSRLGNSRTDGGCGGQTEGNPQYGSASSLHNRLT